MIFFLPKVFDILVLFLVFSLIYSFSLQGDRKGTLPGGQAMPNRQQPKKQPITIRRGEGGGAARGGPLWSPAGGTLHMLVPHRLPTDGQGHTGGHKGPHTTQRH